jgi:uncharacterized protein (TIGR02246 family)
MLLSLILAATLTSENPAAVKVANEISVSSVPSDQSSDAREIADLVSKQYSAWNAGDIAGYLSVFWNSPKLLYVSEYAIWRGWNEVKANLERQFPDPSKMGHPVLEHLETNMVAVDTATTLETWSVTFPSAVVVHGVTSSAWHKQPEGWRIIEGQTSVVESP